MGQIELGTFVDAAGKRHRPRKRVMARTKAELAAKMGEVRSTVAQGLAVVNQVATTGDWLNWWATEILPRQVQPKTLDSYRWILGAYVTPHVGKVPLPSCNRSTWKR